MRRKRNSARSAGAGIAWRRALHTWAPVLLLECLVLFLSTRERLRPPAGLPHLDKAAHFAEYALLGALVHRALRRSGVGRAGSWILTGLVVGGLGAGDEWLQGRVRGRESSALDWLADFAGGWIGAGLDEWRRARAAARAPRRAEEEAGGAVIGDTEG